MTAELQLSKDASYLILRGALQLHTVVGLRRSAVRLLQAVSHPNPTFDLAAVTECDSSALALLTALTRDTQKIGKQAHFIHLPAQLMAIAKLSGLDKVLSLSAAL
jgi:phospholipid transport system transporter-binding protein